MNIPAESRVAERKGVRAKREMKQETKQPYFLIFIHFFAMETNVMHTSNVPRHLC